MLDREAERDGAKPKTITEEAYRAGWKHVVRAAAQIKVHLTDAPGCALLLVRAYRLHELLDARWTRNVERILDDTNTGQYQHILDNLEAQREAGGDPIKRGRSTDPFHDRGWADADHVCGMAKVAARGAQQGAALVQAGSATPAVAGAGQGAGTGRHAAQHT